MAVLPPDPLFRLKSDMGYVHGMCFDQDENKSYTDLLYACTELGYVYVWDLNVRINHLNKCDNIKRLSSSFSQNNRMKHKQQMGESIQSIHNLGNDVLITQEKSGSLKVWQQKDNQIQLLRNYNFYGGYCKSQLINDQLLLPQGNSSCFESIHVDTFERLRMFQIGNENVGHVMCFETIQICGRWYVLAGYESGHLALYELDTGKICCKLKLHEECITSITFDSVSRRGVCCNLTNTIRIFTIDENLNFKLKCEINITNDGCTLVKVRPDRKILVSGGTDARIRLYSWKTLRTLAVLNEHKKTITDVQFTPKIVKTHNAKLMLCSSADGSISLWNLYN